MRFLLLFLLSITNSVTFAQDYPTQARAAHHRSNREPYNTQQFDDRHRHFELLENIRGRTQLDGFGMDGAL